MKLIKASPTGVVCCFASGLLTGSLLFAAAGLCRADRPHAAELSVLIAVGTTAALIVQYPVGYISDHYGRRPVIIGANGWRGGDWRSVIGADAGRCPSPG